MRNLVIPIALGAPILAQTPAAVVEPIKELGRVEFARDLDKVLGTEPEKPVFLLFQEIPGWSTCVEFGQQVLSHPLLVEAIENEFVPVVVHNNKKGKDAELLKRYEEPSWNNPVVRFVDAEGKDLIARRDRVWSLPGIASRMVLALQAAKRPVPDYLRLLSLGTQPKFLRKASFAMYWYWEGEAVLGALPGVVRTRSGWLDKKEVVEVLFDPSVTPYTELLEKARCVEKPSTAYVYDAKDLEAATKKVGAEAQLTKAKPRDAKASDQKYYLRKTPYWYLPLTDPQAARINAAVAAKKSGREQRSVLSASQLRLLARVEKVFVKQRNRLSGLVPARDWRRFAAYTAELTRALDTTEKR